LTLREPASNYLVAKPISADRTTMFRINSLKNILCTSIAIGAMVATTLPAWASPQPRKVKTTEGTGISGEARELRNKGIVELNLSRYDEAVKLLEQAYELSRDPAILFDLVQAHRLNGNPDRALTLCASFLRTAPSLTPRTREQIERTAAELGIIIEQLQLQGRGNRPVGSPTGKVAVKEKGAQGEATSVDATEPPPAVAAEPTPTKESAGTAAGPLPSSAAKEPVTPSIDRSAELLRNDSITVQAGPRKPLYRSPWVWAAAGLVVSGVAAYIVYETAKDHGPPRTSWGAVRAF